MKRKRYRLSIRREDHAGLATDFAKQFCRNAADFKPWMSTMLYEAEAFARLVETNDVAHPGLEVSRITAKLLSEIRRQTGVVFPWAG
jgi:hypothetical protein